MKIFRCEQGTEEWFAVKLGKVSASHFSDVLNKKSGRRTYMYRLLGERLSGESYEAYSNKTMERGSEVEAEARAYYEALYGVVEQVGFVQLNDNVGCSPDGLPGTDGLIEIKCPFPSTHARYIIENTLPTAHKPQVQGNLWITGRQWCDFISFDPRVKARPFWKIRVYRDEKYISELHIQIQMFVNELNKMMKILTEKPF